jgi:hypothetical protein
LEGGNPSHVGIVVDGRVEYVSSCSKPRQTRRCQSANTFRNETLPVLTVTSLVPDQSPTSRLQNARRTRIVPTHGDIQRHLLASEKLADITRAGRVGSDGATQGGGIDTGCGRAEGGGNIGSTVVPDRDSRRLQSNEVGRRRYSVSRFLETYDANVQATHLESHNINPTPILVEDRSSIATDDRTPRPVVGVLITVCRSNCSCRVQRGIGRGCASVEKNIVWAR